uniref:Uncharacterized protein n=1 Tax=Tetranychus urticae TaxID=32264 RepID=T1KDZ3_TETUR
MVDPLSSHINGLLVIKFHSFFGHFEDLNKAKDDYKISVSCGLSCDPNRLSKSATTRWVRLGD